MRTRHETACYDTWKRRTGLIGAMAVAATVAFSGAAQASEITELLTSRGAASITLSDEDRENVIQRDDNQTIDVGDSIFGIFALEQVMITDEETFRDTLGEEGTNELTGVFQIRVASKTADGSINRITGTPNFDYTFAPDTASLEDRIDFELSEGTMVAFFEDSTVDLTRSIDEGTSDDQVARATNGEFFLEVGFSSTDGNGASAAAPGEFWIGQGPDDISMIGQLSSSLAPANSNFGVSRTSNRGNGGDLLIVDQDSGVGTVEFFGNSNIRGTDGINTDFDFTSDTTFDFALIPTPAALPGGLMLLGIAALRRRRKA